MRQRFDDTSLQTGEDNVDVQEKAGIEATRELRREGVLLKTRGDDMKALDKNNLRSEIQRSDEELESKSSPTALTFLPQEELELLQTVFGNIDLEQLQAAFDRLPDILSGSEQQPEQQPEQQRPAMDEGFAIVLQSALQNMPEALKGIANQPEQTFRGDNLSFEGAKNPLIFAALWLQAQMEQGERTQAAKEGQLDDGLEAVAVVEQRQLDEGLGAVESIQRQTFSDALKDFESVPQDTEELLAKAQQADDDIRRNRRV